MSFGRQDLRSRQIPRLLWGIAYRRRRPFRHDADDGAVGVRARRDGDRGLARGPRWRAPTRGGRGLLRLAASRRRDVQHLPPRQRALPLRARRARGAERRAALGPRPLRGAQARHRRLLRRVRDRPPRSLRAREGLGRPARRRRPVRERRARLLPRRRRRPRTARRAVARRDPASTGPRRDRRRGRDPTRRGGDIRRLRARRAHRRPDIRRRAARRALRHRRRPRPRDRRRLCHRRLRHGRRRPGVDRDPARLRGHDDPRRRHRAQHGRLPDGMTSLWVDEPVVAPAREAVVAPRRRRRPARPQSAVADILAGLAGLGLGITVALAVGAESAGSLRAPGGIATALGRLSGLLAAYAMVVVVLLVARVPALERAIGQDRLVRWHRKLGPWPLYLLVAHAVLITVGYARAAHDGPLHQFGQLLWTYPGILAATVGGVALIAAGVTSYRLARRRMAYETWWSVHLYTYLALFLSFSHQVDTGASFVGHPVTRAWWTVLWAGTLALVLGARLGLPLWRSLRHRVRVIDVVPESPGIVSVVLAGRRLDRLPVAGGQFLQWRFLRRGLWWQAHPYSLSAVPAGDRLRITVKDLGDHSRGLAALTPGTPVAIEGPYGAFTRDARRGDKLLLIGAGVGTAPIHSLLQDLPRNVDVVVLSRASSSAELVLREDLERETRRRGGRLLELVGPRERVPLDAAALRRLVRDLSGREVYLCGPEGFTTALAAALGEAGVPATHIHFE